MPIVSIIKASTLSDYLGRIDAEFYKPASLTADAKIKAGNYRYLGRLVKDGYRVVYENTKILQPTQVNEERDCRFLQATNISEDGLWIDVPNIGWVSERDWVRYPKGRVEHGEILIEVKGSAEKVTIVQDYLPLRTLVTGTVFKLTLKKDFISHEYLFAFFNSRYGKILRDRTKVNTLISYVSKPELYRIPIFIPDTNSHRSITSLVSQSFEQQKLSKLIYEDANNLLRKELHLDTLHLQKPKGYTSKFSEVVDRLRADADYFQVKYRQMENHIKQFSTRKLSSICNLEKGIEVGSKAYTEKGQLFIRVSNVSNMEIKFTNSDKYISNSTYNNAKKLKPEIGDILLTKDGTIGIAHVVDEEVEGIISSGIFKMQTKDTSVPKEYLALAINSQFCQMQAERDCSGALILHWKPEDVRKLRIPILDAKTMQTIADLVTSSKEARRRSKQLLNEAKRQVEEIIEQSASKKTLNKELEVV